jgi:hypothetical protein
MKEYQQNQLALNNVDNIAVIRDQYESMKKAGLGNTANVKVLEGLIQDAENYSTAQEFIEDCRRYKQQLPESFIISIDQFNKVVSDYHLIINELSMYTGVVPPEKVNYILMISKTIQRNDFDFNEGIMHASRLYIRSSTDKERKDVKALEKYLAIHPILKGKINRYDYTASYRYVKDLNPEIPEVASEANLEVEGCNLDHSSMLIAAPEKCFIKDFEVSVKPVDPIVFQYCKYGVIVHAVWGDESDSEILNRYKEFASKI